VDSENALLEHVYGGLHRQMAQHRTLTSGGERGSLGGYLAERCILTTTNNLVDRINETIMDQVDGTATVVRSADSVSDTAQAALYPPEFLNSINISGVPPHQMTLKVFTQSHIEIVFLA
jgi:hypothetical protein